MYINEKAGDQDMLITDPPGSAVITDYYKSPKLRSGSFADLRKPNPPQQTWVISNQMEPDNKEKAIVQAGWISFDTKTFLSHSASSSICIRIAGYRWFSMAKCQPPGILIPEKEPDAREVDLRDYFKNSCGEFSFFLFSDISKKIPVFGGKIRFAHGEKTIAALYNTNHEESNFTILTRDPVPNTPNLRENYSYVSNSPSNPFLIGLVPGVPSNSRKSLAIPPSHEELTIAISSESVKTEPRSAGLRIRTSDLRQTSRGENTAAIRYAGLSAVLNQDGFFSFLANSIFSEPCIITLCETVRMAAVPVMPIPLDQFQTVPDGNKPAGKIQGTSGTLQIHLNPGEAVLAMLKPVSCTQNGLLQAEYQSSANQNIHLSLIAFNAREANWNAIDPSQKAYITKRNTGLSIQSPDTLLVDYNPPDRYLIPAMQAINDSSLPVEIQINTCSVYKTPPLVDYAMNPNVTASPDVDTHFPYGVANYVKKNLSPVLGKTDGEVRWCEMNYFRTPAGMGSMLLQPSGVEPKNAANIVIGVTAEPGLLTSEAAVLRISGATGTISLMNMVEGGFVESCLTINANSIAPGQWTTIRSTIVIPDSNHKMDITVQSSGGNAVITVDDIIPRQIEDERNYFDQAVFRYFSLKNNKE